MPRPTVLALATLAAFGGAHAQTHDGQPTLQVGAGLLGGNGADRARELDLRWQRQGDWSLSIDAGQGVRDDPREPSTGTDLTIKRTGAGISFAKILSPRLQTDLSLRSERKEGARLFGVGFSCPSPVAPGCAPTTGTEVGWGVLLLPEPIDAQHSEIEARVSYAFDRLQLSAGYHGSFYDNRLGSLTPIVPATLNNALGTPLPPSTGLAGILAQPVALSPDNQAHHVDVSGTYAFTPATRANFKLGWSEASQHQDFAAAGLTGAPPGITRLGGKVTTTLLHAGLSARPWPKVSLQGNLRWVDRDDDTPLALYNVEDASAYTNRQLSHTRWRARLQANYQFTADVRGTLGADHEAIDRGTFTPTSAVAGITALRQKTDETTLRAEVRRRMNEDFSGAASVASSRRDGSNWLRDNSGVGVTEVADESDPSAGFSTGIFMPTLADRRRDSVKINADWQPSEALQVQVSAQAGRDHYDTPSVYGLRSSRMTHADGDATYLLSDKWSLNGTVFYGTERLRQSRPAGYILSFDNTTAGIGAGFTGKPRAKLEVGGSLMFANDKSVYAQGLDAAADAGAAALLAATGGLPDIVFRQATLHLFGKADVTPGSEVRLDLVHQRSKWTDWAWSHNGVPFVYSDGSTVTHPVRRNATFVGVRYVHRWH
jgi:MtrB/PioB family decaheme-associated outer membrane protein